MSEALFFYAVSLCLWLLNFGHCSISKSGILLGLSTPCLRFLLGSVVLLVSRLPGFSGFSNRSMLIPFVFCHYRFLSILQSIYLDINIDIYTN
jgi:hypothetical protein